MSLGPLMIGIEGTELSGQERRWLESPLLGGVILFERNYASRAQVAALVSSIHEVRKPSLLVAIDQEGGRVQRFKAPFAVLPPMRSIGHLFDQDEHAAVRAAREIGWLMAAELRSCDLDLSFAPVVDLDLGIADVIGDRAFHSNVDAVVRLSTALIHGMEEAGMTATAKHFPTHAGVHADSHTELAVDQRDYPDLMDDLLPYRELIGRGLHAVMVSHVSFPQLDPMPASMSRWWIEEQLRSELGFSGAVISDDIGMLGAAVAGSVPERARRALEAGCDLVLACNVPADVPALLDALDGYSDPSAQLRLMRVRGSTHADWDELREDPRRDAVIAAIAQLVATPTLELRG